MQELLRTLTFKINKYGAYQKFSYLTLHHLSCCYPWGPLWKRTSIVRCLGHYLLGKKDICNRKGKKHYLTIIRS